jgi:hypothetical protein
MLWVRLVLRGYRLLAWYGGVQPAAGVEFAQANRKGGNHDIWMLDGMMITIPRHNDIPERTTRDIYRECEPKLGKDWWK